MQTPETLECARCGLPVRHTAGGLALCAVCGAVSPAPARPAAPRPGREVPAAAPPAPGYDELDLDELRAERRALEREVERWRRAVVRASRLPRRIALFGSLAVAAAAAVVTAGVSAAFRWYGSINYRYVAAYGVVFVFFCLVTLSIVVWAARDPRAPVRRLPRQRLVAARRALRDVERRIAERERSQ